MKQLLLLFIFFSMVSLVDASQLSRTKPMLPLQVGAESIIPLWDLADTVLQQNLEKVLYKNHTWQQMIQKKKMTVGIVDLTDPSKVHFASVNGDEMMYAASLPKLAILLTAFYCFENKIIKQTPGVMKDLALMIRKSDNQAASRMIERVTMERIQKVLTMECFGFYDEAHGGGLWVGKKYARSGKRMPEPMKGLSHAATASQVCRFYYLLAMGKLISRERSREMLGILVNPGIDHKFVKTLRKISPDSTLFRKSGTWKTWHSDSVLVWGSGWRRYIAVALIDDPQGEMILRQLIPEIEKTLKLAAKKSKSTSIALGNFPQEERGSGGGAPIMTHDFF
ncbi:MAG: class A beta-lactamase-related serine hydrolase [Proteobacteria bacterium]|nr:class A beta-lactamase-related serine hydrolase [Pseudomonadota bacterium]